MASLTPHAVILPFPHQGHVIPAVHLAIQLASSGFKVTFVNTERNQEKFLLSHREAAFARQQSPSIDLRFVTIPDGLPQDFVEGPPGDHPRHGGPSKDHPRPGNPPPPRHRDAQGPGAADLTDAAPVGHDHGPGPGHGHGPGNGPPGHPPPPDPVIESLSKQGPVFEKLIEDLQATGSRVSCLIADDFMPWAGDIAEKLNIPRVVFWTASATWLKEEASHKGPKPDENPPDLPFSKETPSSDAHLASHHPPPEGQKRHMHDKKHAMEIASCVLVNSCDELEREAVAVAPVKAPIWNIGPLIYGAAANYDMFHGSLEKADEECLPWLDTQKTDSVVYICFGSRGHLQGDQLVELARGIEASGKPFLWVERRVEQLPEGFLERTKGFGRVVKWAPQREVLGHRSVGAFVSHCGWNSVLETLAKGLPMVLWPQHGDQWSNMALVQEQWKIGKGLVEKGSHGGHGPGGHGPGPGGPGEAKEVVPSSKVSKVLNEVIEDEEMRDRARLLSHSARDAMSPGGSSLLHLQSFLHHIQSSSPK